MKLYRESRRYREMKFKIGIIVFSFPFFLSKFEMQRGGGSKLKKPGFRENERKE